MVTLKDVAKLAGVSEGAASLALNMKPGISTSTRQRVVDAAESLGYTPNRIARGLATRQTHTIGLVVTDIENPFFASVTRYIAEFLREHEYTAILSVSNDDFNLESNLVSRFVGSRVDGVIVVPSLLTVPSEVAYLRNLAAHSIPVVFCTSYYPGIPGDCVMADLEDGSYRLTRHLIELGHREILLFTTRDLEVAPCALRVAGFRRALNDAGLKFRDEYIVRCRYPDYNSGYLRALEVLQVMKPDAITAMNDFLALGIIKAVDEARLAIPGDISVAGYDDVLIASLARHALTTVRQNIRQICQETVHLLIDKLAGREPETRMLKLPTEMLVRETTGLCRNHDSHILGF